MADLSNDWLRVGGAMAPCPGIHGIWVGHADRDGFSRLNWIPSIAPLRPLLTNARRTDLASSSKTP